MGHVVLGLVQCSLGDGEAGNVDRVENLVRQAAFRGATLIVTPELFEFPYFPQTQDPMWFTYAQPVEGNPLIARFSQLARELGVVLPVSFFEKAGAAYFNSVAVIDADGEMLGVYRKTHIPDGPGYNEKFYFRSGRSQPEQGGYRVWNTSVGCVGVGICWDQWFPEASRAMVAQGAEILLYPTAIGSEPEEPDNETRLPWQRVMVGQAVANAVPVAAANRIGREQLKGGPGLSFYGASFVCDHRGEVLADLGDGENVQVVELDLAQSNAYRDAWGFFRDR